MIDHESIAESIASKYRDDKSTEGPAPMKKGFHGRALKAAFENDDHVAIEELVRRIAKHEEEEGE